jgi:hypothetical protein
MPSIVGMPRWLAFSLLTILVWAVMRTSFENTTASPDRSVCFITVFE